MMERVIVWGAGGHGRVVAEVVRLSGREFVGFADRHPAHVASRWRDVFTCGEDELLAAIQGGSLPKGASRVALGVGDNAARLLHLEQAAGFVVPACVHPRAIVSESATIGEGTVVFAGAIVNPDAVVGAGVIVNSGAVIEHDCVLEDGVHVSPNATLCGGVRIERGAWVGAGATVLPGITVASGAIIAAGATVVKHVSERAVVVGPAATNRPGRSYTKG